MRAQLWMGAGTLILFLGCSAVAPAEPAKPTKTLVVAEVIGMEPGAGADAPQRDPVLVVKLSSGEIARATIPAGCTFKPGEMAQLVRLDHEWLKQPVYAVSRCVVREMK